jgi:hypothetical protein
MNAHLLILAVPVIPGAFPDRGLQALTLPCGYAMCVAPTFTQGQHKSAYADPGLRRPDEELCAQTILRQGARITGRGQR